MNENTQRTPLGAHVRTTPGSRAAADELTGRVTEVHAYGCPESDAWLRGQRLLGDDPARFADARWISVLVHGGGAVVLPDLPAYVERVEPFTLDNLYAVDYFPADDVAATWPPLRYADPAALADTYAGVR